MDDENGRLWAEWGDACRLPAPDLLAYMAELCEVRSHQREPFIDSIQRSVIGIRFDRLAEAQDGKARSEIADHYGDLRDTVDRLFTLMGDRPAASRNAFSMAIDGLDDDRISRDLLGSRADLEITRHLSPFGPEMDRSLVALRELADGLARSYRPRTRGRQPDQSLIATIHGLAHVFCLFRPDRVVSNPEGPFAAFVEVFMQAVTGEQAVSLERSIKAVVQHRRAHNVFQPPDPSDVLPAFRHWFLASWT